MMWRSNSDQEQGFSNVENCLPLKKTQKQTKIKLSSLPYCNVPYCRFSIYNLENQLFLVVTPLAKT